MAQKDVFHTLHHVCIVVRDMDTAIAFYESIGIGPWHSFPSLEMYLGELDVPSPEAFLRLHYRYANIANVQIQLCAPPEGASPQRAFLERQGEGVFHLGFSVPDCDEAEAKAIAMGLQTKMRGRVPSRQGFTYFETANQGAGVTLEIRATDMS
ncbi:VOC family protein [Cupriavidus necator]